MSCFDNNEARWDHERDEIKHGLASRPLTTAVDIAVLVRGMDNIQASADLIDAYARMIAAGARVEEAQKIADKIGARA